ncbi:MAG: C25 family cysteine peptidase [Lentimicrobiaceae bacterium]|nr:C25 family cysteine peptidase [Lentimicrobiaceae bacterium]
MKKLSLFLLVIFTITTGVFAQNQVLTVGSGALQNEIVLLQQNNNQTTIRFDLNLVELFEVETDYGIASIPISEKAPLMLEKGAPELFYFTTSFIIPDKGGSELEISYGQYQEFENIEIAPSKGNLPRSINPSNIPFEKGEVYQIDDFFPGTLANLREPFIMRDVRGESLDVYPVQYNPVTKILRIYSEITVTVRNTPQQGINEFTTQKRHKTIDPTFNQMYNNLFINYSSLNRAYPTGEEGELLIICYPQFMNDMQPYVDWKRTIGRKTTMVSTAETGATYAAIKNYIQDYYSNPDHNLAYVLLVGDLAQIPTYTYTTPYYYETCYSDIYYAQLVSGVYMDILIGRMSAENIAHVQTQVERSIWYERDLTTEDTWLSKAVGLAANNGPAGSAHNNEYDYTHMNNIRTRLMTYGYNPVYQEYNGNCPGVTNTTTAQISSRFNEGMGVANYCNHGDYDGWYIANAQETAYIPFTNSNVNALQNAGMLPYIFSVACLNGQFNKTCFAEAWMRATKNGQPTGAVATMMGSIELSWVPPMTAQDEFVNICLDLGPYTGQAAGIKRTFAGASLNASQKMRMTHGTSANDDYNAWLVFGDPTLMFRTKTPEEMTVSHLPVIPVGTNEFSVECDADGAQATVSYVENSDVIILGTATVIDGVAEIVFDAPLSTFTDLTLAVTGFNKVTYITNLLTGELPDLHTPQNLSYSVENANHILLEWETPEEIENLAVTGYNIYRDELLINTEPVINEVSFTDIVPTNGEYKYEVTALYGTTLESDPSEPVLITIDGMCIPFGNKIILEQPEEEEGVNILVSWEAPEYEGTELAGYNIFRDEEQINTEIVTELSYLDENLEQFTEYCYQVEVVYNDCEETLKSEKECLTTLSINDVSEIQNFNIYPNPANNELRVTSYELQITSIEIYDVYGRNVSSHHLIASSPHHLINISHLQSGIYFVKIYSETGDVAVKRLVVMK